MPALREIRRSSKVNAVWHLNGDSTDDGGGGFNGTDTNISYVNGRLSGTSADFNGSSSVITFSNNVLISPDLFTFLCWINLDTVSGNHTIYGPAGGGTSTGAPQFRMKGAVLNLISNGVGEMGSSSTSLSISTWYFVGVAYNDTSGAFKFFLNGVPDGSGTSIREMSPLTMGLGRNYDTSPEWFDGRIEEFAIYNEFLSDADVLAIYRYQTQIYKY